MTKLLQQCFLFFIVVVIPGHNLGNSQVSVNRTIVPTLVFIDDMPEVLNCCIKLFADGAKVYSSIKAENDRIRLQVGVNNAQE